MFRTYRLIVVLLLFAFAAGSLAAAPLPCLAASLDTYLALADGCTVGTYTFSGFQFSVLDQAGMIAPLDASDILVSTGSSFLGALINFEASFVVSGAQAITYLFVYTITGTTPPASGLRLQAFTEIPPTPPGRFQITTDVASATTQVFHNGGNDFTLDSTTGFAPSASFTVRNTVRLEGNDDGDAQFASFSNTALNVPEPSTLGFVLTGLILAAARWRAGTSRAAGS